MLSKLKVIDDGSIRRPGGYLVSVHFILVAWIERLLCWLLLLLMLFPSRPTSCKHLGKCTVSLIVNTPPQWCCTDWQKRSHLNWLNLGRPRASVKMSAMFWSVGIWCNWMTSRSTRSRTKWCLMSMCLLRLCVIGFWASLIAPRLSPWRRIGPSRSKPKLFTRDKR